MNKLSSFWSKVDELAEFAEPVKRFATNNLTADNSLVSKFLKTKPKMKTPKGMEWDQGFMGNLKRGTKTSIGNTAHTLKSMKERGVTNTALDQVRSDLYKELPSPTTYKKGGKHYAKAKANFLSDREVKAFTDRGGAIVRKRKVLTPLSVGLGTSGASMAGLSYWAQDDKKPIASRAGRAAAEGALFGLNPAVGMGALMAPMFMGSESKKISKNKIKQQAQQRRAVNTPTKDQMKRLNNVRVQQQ